MVVSSSFSGERQPARSISLPSRLDNHNSIIIQSVLERLNLFRPSSSNSTPAPLSGEEIDAGLVKLAELYNCVEELVQSPVTKRDLLHYQDGKLVQESLHGSVVLLDSCGCARDAMVAMRDHVQTLQSALRRKGVHSSTETLIRTYILCRKRVKKDIAKCIQQLKKMEAKILLSLPDSDHHLWLLLQPLREASLVAISVLKSLMMFLSMPVVHNKRSKWDLISQLMLKRSKSVEDVKGSEVENEMVSVELCLGSITMGCRESMADQVQIAQRMLGRLYIVLHGIEAELETVFRCLLRHRVSFLKHSCPLKRNKSPYIHWLSLHCLMPKNTKWPQNKTLFFVQIGIIYCVSLARVWNQENLGSHGYANLFKRISSFSKKFKPSPK